MNEAKDDRLSVYEIGYLIASSVPEEKVPAEADAIKAIVTGAGAEVIADEAPHFQQLAYSMRVKMVSGAYEKYDSAYFGWIKFELGSSKIEAVKKAIEVKPSVLRMLLITTVREQTYLGKRAQSIGMPASKEGVPAEEKKDAPPATLADMDKSIEEMVKEA
jgi:ribosomal protein S6